ncbi:aminotransferase class V-fold PLP-dependent enzyme [Patescibacteria group bacterium]
MDINQIRKDFPIFKSQPELIYFDNACMTLRPQSVIDAVNKYYTEYPVCAGRSAHKLADRLTQDIEQIRLKIAKFIGAKKKEEIIFTKSTTDAINLVANSLDLKKGDVVLGTDKEHNSNLAPWLRLVKNKGIVYTALPSREDNSFDLEELGKTLKVNDGKIKLVAMVMTSNLDGTSIPAKEVVKVAHQYGALVLLDAAQAVPHSKVDVRNLDADFLAFSGHKMCGPSGTGILYGRKHLLEGLEPSVVGGGALADSKYDSYELLPLPERLEAGLQNFAGILGLGAAVEYIEKIGFKNIQEQELKLNKFITEQIGEVDKRIKIIGPEEPALRSGIITMHCTDLAGKSHEIGLMLDKMANIAVRSGQFCVHSWFNARNIQGALRASFYFYNTMDEAEKFVEVLKKIVKLY